ncbi:MAG: porin [Gammaproteobacteria bacterium]
MPGTRRIAAAIAAAATLAGGSAGATETRGAIYTDLRLSVDYTDDSSLLSGPTWNVTDNNSTWGVKGSTVKGGVTVFGGYERFVSADQDPLPGFPIELTRQAYLGMTSFCGTIKAGKHSTAYADAGRRLDPFYNTAASGSGGLAAAGSMLGGGNSHGSSAAFNADFLGSAFVANQLAYQSPAWKDFTGNVAVFLDESNTSDQDHGFGVGADYQDEGLAAGLQFISAQNANPATWGMDTDALRLHVSYAATTFGAGLSWESLDTTLGSADYLMLSGWYGLTENTRIAASLGVEDASPSEGSSLRLGVFHDVMDAFTVWAAARTYDDSSGAAVDSFAVTFGAGYKFSLGFTQ